MDYLLTTNSLTKRYGRHKAVDKLNIHVKNGDIYGLIGRNGAGKTTALKMLCGLAAPTEGDFTFFGKTGKEALPLMSRIGSLIEQPGVYMNMSAKENLKIKCIANGIKTKGYEDKLLKSVGLGDVGSKRVKSFSLGMKQRLGIALALVGEPDLLILDEPINGLDPQGIVEVRDIILRLNKENNMTIIISSHILEELSKIATNYGIIHNGELLEEISREELMAKCSERIELVTDNVKGACVVIEEMSIKNYKVVDDSTILIFEHLGDCGEITLRLAEKSIKTLAISVKSEALEDYYLNMTGGSANV